MNPERILADLFYKPITLNPSSHSKVNSAKGLFMRFFASNDMRRVSMLVNVIVSRSIISRGLAST